MARRLDDDTNVVFLGELDRLRDMLLVGDIDGKHWGVSDGAVGRGGIGSELS